ncbi:MAG: DUF5331 domain-containing protein, partial [Microcystaceae cyanobacterium]
RQLVSPVSPQSPIALAEIKPILKEKWLAFFTENADLLDIFDIWIDINIDSGEKRPHAVFLLAAIAVLEPRVKDYLIALCGVDKTGTKVIEALELNFDPRLELEKQKNNLAQTVDLEYEEINRYLNEIRGLKIDGNSS